MKRSEPMSESYYYILLCLARGANHGYGIMQMTERLSGGDVTIGSGTTGDHEGNADADGFLGIDGEEVDMQAVVLDGVELQFVYDGGVGLAIENEIYDVGSRRVQETLKIAIVNGEEDIVQTLAIEVAGNETLAAEGLDDGLVSDLADLALQFKMLHAFCFKMCYSVRKTVRTPLHQKLFAFILGLQR